MLDTVIKNSYEIMQLSFTDKIFIIDILVLNFCLTRVLLIDSTTNFSSLQLSWASKSSCLQRAGRAGRVMNGRCYHFVDKQFYDVSFILTVEQNRIVQTKILCFDFI